MALATSNHKLNIRVGMGNAESLKANELSILEHIKERNLDISVISEMFLKNEGEFLVWCMGSDLNRNGLRFMWSNR